MNTKTQSSNSIMFVHADLDLYGLKPYEFRIYAHIARRGTCYSTVKKIAEICKMSVRKTQYALRYLEKQGMIEQSTENRKGKTYTYTLAPREQWKPPEPSSEGIEKERQKVDQSLKRIKEKELESNDSGSESA
ncbi:helix-turn-helix domain-containing protein [Roseofilum reptotaenium CS-1145]|uniref:Uncharacterized protein n=1 Tax=Roseofilum reptotaenium AO1-A TaxID=1925591 RepID=A0A1L9QSA3_9CYAN|nr:helix-turn-helix domain-containing protein [Roseofilum reptotaenium]MDB9518251.1 helix-turn-helix domain-containing protein [Roseofilum reptotaenium CS-1145]OJJ25541.1 hypothetical protein BI308_11305 [Roseofilum reptotaenium AO1-A]